MSPVIQKVVYPKGTPSIVARVDRYITSSCTGTGLNLDDTPERHLYIVDKSVIRLNFLCVGIPWRNISFPFYRPGRG